MGCLVPPVPHDPQDCHEHVEQIEIDLNRRADVFVRTVEVAQAPGVEDEKAAEQENGH